MLKSIYNCTQQELYTICNLGWVSCNQNLADFTSFKPKYTMAFVTGRQADVTAAQLLPDDQQRGEAAETARVILAAQAIVCLNTWQKLKRYIADAWPVDLQKSKTEAAGQDYYRGASNNNWDEVQGLMTSGHTFINDNMATLTAGMNMPVTFNVDFANIRDDFNTKHQDFLDKEGAAQIATEEKQEANNNIYTSLISMFLDGQEIYKNEEAIQKLFIFEQVLQLVSGSGNSGFKGTVIDSLTLAPIPNAIISITPNNKVVNSDALGHYEMITASGTYHINVTAPGYQPIDINNYQVDIGVQHTLNFSCVPV